MTFSYVYESHGDKHFDGTPGAEQWHNEKEHVKRQAIAYMEEHAADMEYFRSIQDNKSSFSFFIVGLMSDLKLNSRETRTEFDIQGNMDRVKGEIGTFFTRITYHLYPNGLNPVRVFGIGKTEAEAVENSKK